MAGSWWYPGIRLGRPRMVRGLLALPGVGQLYMIPCGTQPFRGRAIRLRRRGHRGGSRRRFTRHAGSPAPQHTERARPSTNKLDAMIGAHP